MTMEKTNKQRSRNRFLRPLPRTDKGDCKKKEKKKIFRGNLCSYHWGSPPQLTIGNTQHRRQDVRRAQYSVLVRKTKKNRRGQQGKPHSKVKTGKTN